MYRIFGVDVPVELAFACMALLAVCLFALRLRHVLLLCVTVLMLTSLRLPYHGIARLLRWPLLVALAGKGLVAKTRPGQAPPTMTASHFFVGLLAVLALGSAAYSMGWQLTLATAGMMVVLWVGVFLVAWRSWVEEDDLLVICHSMFYLAALIFSLEALFRVTGWGQVTAQGRWEGVFTNPNGLGTAVAFFGPFVYWKHRVTESASLKFWIKILGAVMVSALVLSGSRSGILGSIICMGTMLAYAHRLRFALVVVLIGTPLVLFAVLGPTLTTEELEESKVVRLKTLPTLTGRVDRWKRAFYFIEERPLLGYGYGVGKFVDLGRADFQIAQATVRLRGENYHSAHVLVLLELGVTGLALFWLFLLSVVRRGIAMFLARRESPMALAGIVFYAAFLASLGDSFVHGWAFSPGSSQAIIFWLIAAAVLRAHRFVFEPIEEPAPAADLSESLAGAPTG